MRYRIIVELNEDKLSAKEHGLLYRLIWKFFETHCINVTIVDIKEDKQDG